jgi:quercetin dioxygenase-like cupin family protein
MDGVVDLLTMARTVEGQGPIWSLASSDLNVNLVRFNGDGGVPAHVNNELDVLVLAIEGEGTLELDGQTCTLRAGQGCLIPKGARRAIRSAGDAFVYLTCHRRRGGLWPA